MTENTEISFPAGFIIGASTSAHQTEGNNVSSDWWAIENAQPSRLAQRSGDALDSLSRWPEDMQIAADAGLQAYRFSIEWARIEPVKGQFSRAAFDHYLRMIQGAKERGLEPVITLHHFTNPAWFAQEGGWLGPNAVESFLRYVEYVIPMLEKDVARIVTINEPNMVAIMARVFAGDVDLQTGLGGLMPYPSEQVRDVLIAAHTQARELIKQRLPHVAVGWSVANQVVSWTPEGAAAGSQYREAVEDVFLRASANDDFVGVQSYTRTIIGADGKAQPAGELTLTGWEYYPQSIGDAIRHTAEVVPGVPILVTENGIATADDARRIAYTDGALRSVAACCADGLPVQGYLHWSLLDNYEWGHWEPTFGLIAVDRESFVRTPKPSLAWLGAHATAPRT